MKPNVLFIMTDNQGAWSLGCYGNDDIRTPNIDALAERGVRFANAYCVNSVCSPSRATYMTGLLPSQHGVHCYLGSEKPDSQMGTEAYCTIQEFENLPQALQDKGYRSGLSGKWHLGDSLNPQLGFDYWYTKPRGHTSEFYDTEMIWEGSVYREGQYVTDAITDHAVDYLNGQREADDPFFLYVAYNGPYGLGQSMTDPHNNRHDGYYADKELPSFPREEVHPWLHHNKQIVNNPVSIRGYASAVSGVDDGVGRLMETLDTLGMRDDTIVIYTSDQGLCGGHHGMWGMGDHSRPIHTYEEAVHIPMIVSQPGTIPEGTVFDERTCNYDFFPSFAELLDLEVDLPGSPGRSYAGALRGEPVAGWDGEIYHEFENVRMVRTDRWKYSWRHPDGPNELYDMENDPGERENRAGDAELSSVEKEMRDRISGFFECHADPEYDLWRDGRSKAGRLMV
jgi:arylsulfatase A-like enzyme